MFIKRTITCLGILLLLFGIERFTRSQTDGFRLDKTLGVPSYRLKCRSKEPPLEDEILSQPFYFLGSGVQCYAFISADQRTVLKIFKHHHFGLTTPLLEKISLPKFLDGLRKKTLLKRRERMDRIFASAKIARENLEMQTGVFHLSLSCHNRAYPRLTIYDKIGVRHHLDLNRTPFLLQKKAQLLLPYLMSHKEKVHEVVESFFACIANRSLKGIVNGDPRIDRNYGFLDGKVIEIDIGSFSKNPYAQTPVFRKRELFYETLEMKEWIAKNIPEMSAYFDKQLMRAIET